MSSVRQKNEKIYKHYQIVMPRGCGVNVDYNKLDQMLKLNYLKRSPQRLTETQQKLLNYNYLANSLWLFQASNSKKIVKKEQKMLFEPSSNRKTKHFFKESTRLPSLSVDQVNAHNLINKCTLYKKDVHQSSNEMLSLQAAINDNATQILNKLSPEKEREQMRQKKDYLKLQSTEYLHEFLVQQKNESQVDINSLSPQAKLSTSLNTTINQFWSRGESSQKRKANSQKYKGTATRESMKNNQILLNTSGILEESNELK